MFPSQRASAEAAHVQGKANQDGIIVWDRKGLVIMWQDGHRSRFFWQELRNNCVCHDCQPRKPPTVHPERKAA